MRMGRSCRASLALGKSPSAQPQTIPLEVLFLSAPAHLRRSTTRSCVEDRGGYVLGREFGLLSRGTGQINPLRCSAAEPLATRAAEAALAFSAFDSRLRGLQSPPRRCLQQSPG